MFKNIMIKFIFIVYGMLKVLCCDDDENLKTEYNDINRLLTKIHHSLPKRSNATPMGVAS